MTTINIKTYDSKTGKLIKNETREVVEEAPVKKPLKGGLTNLSMEELREIGDPLGVKDNKKSDLIEKIEEAYSYESLPED